METPAPSAAQLQEQQWPVPPTIQEKSLNYFLFLFFY